MKITIAAVTDQGICRKSNQDSLLVQVLQTSRGKMAFAVLCDGMGGLARGELASKTVLQCFRSWTETELPYLCRNWKESVLWQQWERIITEQNQNLYQYGLERGIRLGTTVLVLLLTETQYYIMNVGDCRVYELTNKIQQLTTDQTVAANAVARGTLTKEQAQTAAYRHVLLQCCGASEQIVPEKICGRTPKEGIYLLCSDGFCHVLSEQEIYGLLQETPPLEENSLQHRIVMLVDRCKQRQEPDNISAAVVKLDGGRKNAGKWFPFGWKI